jgi:hypothetical protein
MMADVNGDGKNDLVGFANKCVGVALSTGHGFAPIQRLDEFGYHAGWRVAKHPRMMADVNGDGRADVVGFGDDGVVVALSAGDTFAAGTIWSNAFGADFGGRPVEECLRMIADVNGDGKGDVVGFGDNGTVVSLSTGSGFTSASTWTDSFGCSSGYRVAQHPRTLADVNGDGMHDVVGFGETGVAVSLSTGHSFTPPQLLEHYGYNRGWRVKQNLRMMADVNGDGLADVVGFANHDATAALSVGAAFVLSREYQIIAYGQKNGWRVDKHPRMMADVNGDGRSDIVAFDELGVWVSLSTEGGFKAPEFWSPDFAS